MRKKRRWRGEKEEDMKMVRINNRRRRKRGRGEGRRVQDEDGNEEQQAEDVRKKIGEAISFFTLTFFGRLQCHLQNANTTKGGSSRPEKIIVQKVAKVSYGQEVEEEE